MHKVAGSLLDYFNNEVELDYIDEISLNKQQSSEWVREDGSKYYSKVSVLDIEDNIFNKFTKKIDEIAKIKSYIDVKVKILKDYRNEIKSNNITYPKKTNTIENKKLNIQFTKKRIKQKKEEIRLKKEKLVTLRDHKARHLNFIRESKTLFCQTSSIKQDFQKSLKKNNTKNNMEEVEIFGLNYNNVKRRMLENILILHNIDDRYGGFCIAKEFKLKQQSEQITQKEVLWIEDPKGNEYSKIRKDNEKDYKVTLDDNSIEGDIKEFKLSKIKSNETTQSIWLFREGDFSSVYFWDPIFHNINLFMSMVANICDGFGIYSPISIRRDKYDIRYHLINQNGIKVYIDLISDDNYRYFEGITYLTTCFIYIYRQLANGNITYHENQNSFYELDMQDYSLEKIESFVTNLKNLETLGPYFKNFKALESKTPLLLLQQTPKLVLDQQYFSSDDEIIYKVVNFYDKLCQLSQKNDVILEFESLHEQINGGVSKVIVQGCDYYYYASIDSQNNIKQSEFSEDEAVKMKVQYLIESVIQTYEEVHFNSQTLKETITKKLRYKVDDDFNSFNSFVDLDSDDFTVIS